MPRESVGEHLGIGSVYEQAPLDELDEQLARTSYNSRLQFGSSRYSHCSSPEHTRFVYNLQEPPSSEESDDPDSDSDDSSSSKRVNRSSRRARAGKQRMSIVTNQVLHHVPRLGENGHGDYGPGCGWPAEAPGASRSSTAKRRFFQSAAQWDDRLQQVYVVEAGLTRVSVAEMMELGGGRGGEQDVSDAEEEMEVDEEDAES